MRNLSLIIFLSLASCNPFTRARAAQTADALCASVATSVHSVKGDDLSRRLALACLDRLERNEALEDALRGVAGAPVK